MGIISRQVWELAHFIKKVVYTRLLAVPDMVPHCHLVKAQGLRFHSFSHFLEFSPSHTPTSPKKKKTEKCSDAAVVPVIQSQENDG